MVQPWFAKCIWRLSKVIIILHIIFAICMCKVGWSREQFYSRKTFWDTRNLFTRLMCWNIFYCARLIMAAWKLKKYWPQESKSGSENIWHFRSKIFNLLFQLRKQWLDTLLQWSGLLQIELSNAKFSMWFQVQERYPF